MVGWSGGLECVIATVCNRAFLAEWNKGVGSPVVAETCAEECANK